MAAGVGEAGKVVAEMVAAMAVAVRKAAREELVAAAWAAVGKVLDAQ